MIAQQLRPVTRICQRGFNFDMVGVYGSGGRGAAPAADNTLIFDFS